MFALKFAEGSDSVLEGWGVPYGGPFNGKDLDGEFFTKSTDLCLDWFPSERPILYNHGLDDETEAEVVGRVKSWESQDQGLWVQAQLDKQSKYYTAIKKLADAGALYFSSGAMPHLVQRKKSGEIARWPWVELSLTPTPINPFATVDVATAEKHYKSAGLDINCLKAVMDAADEPSDATAIKSMEGSYEDLIDDLSALLNPQTPFASDCYSCIVATFPDYVIVHRYDYHADDDADSYWKVAYTVGDDQEPVLGKAEQVEQTYVPVKSLVSASPLTLDATTLTRHAGALAARTKGLQERRIGEGRTLSTANRARLGDAVTSLETAQQTIQTLLDASDRLGRDQAEAKALSQPDALQRRLSALSLFIGE